MGYTTYYARPYRLKKETFLLLVADAKFLYENLPEYSDTAGGYHQKNRIEIRGPWGVDEPIFTEDAINFNGNEHQIVNKEEEDLSHESFTLMRVFEKSYPGQKSSNGLWFSFCKTARKPYDLLVCGVCIALKHHFPQTEISSDGDEHDWKTAVVWYQLIFPDRTLPKDGPWCPEVVLQDVTPL